MTLFLITLLGSATLVGVAAAALPRLGVMDVPNDRSSHQRPVPRGGGIALLPCIALGIGVSASWTASLAWLVIGAAILGIIGFIDDVRDVSASVRLGLQVLVMVALGIGLAATLTDLAAPIGVLVGVAGAVWLTGFVNVFNFMDGANGVAGLQVLVSGGWFAWLGAREDSTTLLAGGLALLGASMGFLPWNYPRARVFLGDVGSYSLGLLVGGLGLAALLSTESVLLAVAPLLVFLTDTTLTLLRRAAARKPVMTAHREHVYQRLTTTPGSPWPAVVTTGASGVCVLAAGAMPWPVCIACWCGALGAYVALPRAAHGWRTAESR